MQIRLANDTDKPAILRLSVQMHAESRFKIYPLNQDRSWAVASALMQSPTGCVLIAENASGEVVGMLWGHVMDYFFSDVRMAQDQVFYVAPAHRGSSAAYKLLTAFKRWAHNRKAKELAINMSVDIDQPRFNRFMTRMGFHPCGTNFITPLSE